MATLKELWALIGKLLGGAIVTACLYLTLLSFIAIMDFVTTL